MDKSNEALHVPIYHHRASCQAHRRNEASSLQGDDNDGRFIGKVWSWHSLLATCVHANLPCVHLSPPPPWQTWDLVLPWIQSRWWILYFMAWGFRKKYLLGNPSGSLFSRGLMNRSIRTGLSSKPMMTYGHCRRQKDNSAGALQLAGFFC